MAEVLCFCREEIGIRTVVKVEMAFAFLTNIPIVPGHVLICPLRCVATWKEMTEDEQDAVMTVQGIVKDVLRKPPFNAQGFHVAFNEGGVAGQTVPHFHMHVVPRMPGDTGITTFDPRQFLYRPGSRAVSPDEELLQTPRDFRESLTDAGYLEPMEEIGDQILI